MSATTITPGGAGRREQVGPGLKRGRDLSAGRQQAVADVVRGLLPPTGRLTPAQLRTITAGLAGRHELWADLVVRDRNVRWYLPLHRSDAFDVWLLAWERGQDTDWHDHGGSSGSFAVAEGCLAEQYRAPGGRRVAHRRVLGGEAVAFGPAHVHDVGHRGGGPASSIHAYSPPLRTMTFYDDAPAVFLAPVRTEAADTPEARRSVNP